MLDLVDISPQSNAAIDQLLYRTSVSNFRKGYVEVGPNRVCLPNMFRHYYDEIEQFQIRNDDIFVITHPKTGTTWTQEMVWLINNNLDFEAAKTLINNRFPFLEVSALFDFSNRPDDKIPIHLHNSVEYVSKIASPRFIKTHLPWELLPKQLRETTSNKIVYVARNPKDTCVSYYHHYKLMEGFTGTFEEFCDLFLENRISYGPFDTHLLTFWERRNQENILYLFYEDMKNDLASVIRKTCDFFQKTYTDEQLERLKHHLRFESMKDNPAVNYESIIAKNQDLKMIDSNGKFMRSGIVGSYKVEMNDRMINRFDQWSAEKFNQQGFYFSA